MWKRPVKFQKFYLEAQSGRMKKEILFNLIGNNKTEHKKQKKGHSSTLALYKFVKDVLFNFDMKNTVSESF